MNVSWFSLATNILTVALSAFALASIARMIADMDRESGYLAAFGAGLITLGGVLTSANNLALLVAGGRGPLALGWLSINLFLLLSPGFICLACAIWHSQQTLRQRRPPRSAWIAPTLLIGLVNLGLTLLSGLPAAPALQTLLLIATTVPSVALSGLCVRQAIWLGAPWVKTLCAGYVLAVVLLNILPALGNPTARMLAQALNVVAALLLMVIARPLAAATRRRLSLRASVASLAG